MKNLIIILLVLQPFYNQEGWRVDGIGKTVVYFLICFCLTLIVTAFEIMVNDYIEEKTAHH